MVALALINAISHLWPNWLIGDEQLPEDFERKGKRLKEWLNGY